MTFKIIISSESNFRNAYLNSTTYLYSEYLMEEICTIKTVGDRK